MSASTEDRAIRQRDLVPPARLATYHAIVVGVGAIGRQVALQLAAMGVPKLTLIDDDTVSIENLAVQGYAPVDLGRAKVDVTAEDCLRLHPQIVIDGRVERFRRSSDLAQQLTAGTRLTVFACVDEMASRRRIFEACRASADCFVDGRMAGEVLRVLWSSSPATDQFYSRTLFEDAAAHPAPCTGRSTLYAASIAAGLMLSRFAAHLRGQSPAADLLLNLLADELVVG